MPVSPAVGPIQSKKEKIGRCGLISIESQKFLVFSGTAVTAREPAPPPSPRGALRRPRPLNRPRQRKGDLEARARDDGVNYASARVGHSSSFGILQTCGRIEEHSTDGTSTGAVDVETKAKRPRRTGAGAGVFPSKIKGIPGYNPAQTVEITPPETQMCSAKRKHEAGDKKKQHNRRHGWNSTRHITLDRNSHNEATSISLKIGGARTEYNAPPRRIPNGCTLKPVDMNNAGANYCSDVDIVIGIESAREGNVSGWNVNAGGEN
ncbi:hypothetical protein B0H13DRAFT_1897483 [Mycena leptocephala]|nr:hypothetical protein B0H13DRAFT_1897483 [Mycena leptocephala]